jgi:hypothetical protein
VHFQRLQNILQVFYGTEDWLLLNRTGPHTRLFSKNSRHLNPLGSKFLYGQQKQFGYGVHTYDEDRLVRLLVNTTISINVYLSCMPKSCSTTNGNKNGYNKSALKYGQRARDRLKSIQRKGQDKG